MASKANFITNGRALATRFLELRFDLLEAKEQWTALDYNTEIGDGDFTGENTGITAAQFKAALLVLMEMLDTNFETADKEELYVLVS